MSGKSRSALLAAVLLGLPVAAMAVPIPLSGEGIYDPALDPNNPSNELVIRTRRTTETPDPVQSTFAVAFDVTGTGDLLWDAYLFVHPLSSTSGTFYDLNESLTDLDPTDGVTRFFGSGLSGFLRANTDYGMHIVFAYQGEGTLDFTNFRVTSVGTSPGASAPGATVALTDPAVVGNPLSVPEPGTMGLLAAGGAAFMWGRRRRPA